MCTKIEKEIICGCKLKNVLQYNREQNSERNILKPIYFQKNIAKHFTLYAILFYV